MENKINLKKRLLYGVGTILAIIAISYTMATLTVYLTSKAHPKHVSQRQGITHEPQTILQGVYRTANNYFAGDSVSKIDNLNGYCSKPLKTVFNRNPGLLLYTFVRETKNGNLKALDIVSQQYKGVDSAIVDARALYLDGSSKQFKQVFIKEDGHWKLGLKYGYDIQ